MWQDSSGSPLELQQVLDCHLGQAVAGVQLHDQPHHDADQHGHGATVLPLLWLEEHYAETDLGKDSTSGTTASVGIITSVL